MAKKLSYLLSVVLLVVLAACGSAAAPGLSVADIQSTGVALAWTGLAMTQTAMPTMTPLSPTDTQPATFTALTTLSSDLPTPAFVGPVSSPTSNNCDQPPPIKPNGAQVFVRFVNKSGGSVNLFFGMNPPNSLGECGTYNFHLGKYDSPTEQVLAGCYWGYGYVTGLKPSTAQTPSALCLPSGQNYGINITPDVISLKP